MPRTEEIPRNRWIEFLDSLTREHRGRHVNVEVMSTELGAQTQARDVPLQGISADVRRAGEHDVSIIVGREENPPLTHIVPQAQRVSIERSDEGSDQALQIEGADGTKTLMRFDLPRAA